MALCAVPRLFARLKLAAKPLTSRSLILYSVGLCRKAAKLTRAELCRCGMCRRPRVRERAFKSKGVPKRFHGNRWSKRPKAVPRLFARLKLLAAGKQLRAASIHSGRAFKLKGSPNGTACRLGNPKQKAAEWLLFVLVEAGGVGPPSENTSSRSSPGAAECLSFPPRIADRRAMRSGSPIIHAPRAGRCGGTFTAKSRPSRSRGTLRADGSL